eukprot:CAMPEP_0204366556 /NCGR_PEP_ID=MMETSP0469-20131031/42750_1 /ASSEMBLY_ACC=CAM_ASM_000384 /TAXON_ID=2969 /ORGANISM="Oxyrrhis marina" /LENGTH=372 /DNA_ID=CAMNT_0051355775 /DNA_START=27 /DNA_END=1142 /DNA_ORIENTATION=-
MPTPQGGLYSGACAVRSPDPKQEDTSIQWTYDTGFQYRWTQYRLQSAIVPVVPGLDTKVTIAGNEVNINIPKEFEGTVGMIIGDPCISPDDYCANYQLDIAPALKKVLNGMSEHTKLDYWMMVGDLFYDQFGPSTSSFYQGLTLKAMTKMSAVTMGNHDYWIAGSPGSTMPDDSLGYGHMQWFAMDALSAKADASKPFDFSGNPDAGNIADKSNFFWYNMIGNVAFIGFSNAYSWGDQYNFFTEACAWVGNTNAPLVVLLGHWNVDGMGCPASEDTPDVFNSIKSIPGCTNLGSKLKYIMGHTHCNQITEKNTGFMLGGMGMAGCGDFGIPILDTRNGRARLLYFALASGGNKYGSYDDTLNCLAASGVDGC